MACHYCPWCLEPKTVVGETFPYNNSFACITCINTIPEDTEEINSEDFHDIYEPPINFDMNSASSVEENPTYMNDLMPKLNMKDTGTSHLTTKSTSIQNRHCRRYGTSGYQRQRDRRRMGRDNFR